MDTMDKKFSLRELFAVSPLCMTGIVIGIAVMIFLAVGAINAQLKLNHLKATFKNEQMTPATQTPTSIEPIRRTNDLGRNWVMDWEMERRGAPLRSPEDAQKNADNADFRR